MVIRRGVVTALQRMSTRPDMSRRRTARDLQTAEEYWEDHGKDRPCWGTPRVFVDTCPGGRDPSGKARNRWGCREPEPCSRRASFNVKNPAYRWTLDSVPARSVRETPGKLPSPLTFQWRTGSSWRVPLSLPWLEEIKVSWSNQGR